MKTAFCLSIGPFWEKRFLGKKFGLFIIFGLRAIFFNLLSNNFLRGFQCFIVCFHQNVSKKKRVFLKKYCKFFHHFRILSKQFLALYHKKFVRSVETGFYVSKGPIWSKKFLFENRSILETSSYLEQQDFIFLLEKFRRGCQSCTLCFCWNIARKTKTFSEKIFLYLFWTLVKEFSVFHRKKPYVYQKCNVRVPRTILKRQMFFWKIDGLRNTFGLWAKTFQSFVDYFFAGFLKLHSTCS